MNVHTLQASKRQRSGGFGSAQTNSAYGQMGEMHAVRPGFAATAAAAAAASSLSVSPPILVTPKKIGETLRHGDDAQRARRIAKKIRTLFGEDTPLLAFFCKDSGSFFVISALGFSKIRVERIQDALYNDMGRDGDMIRDIGFNFRAKTVEVHVNSTAKRSPGSTIRVSAPSHLSKRKRQQDVRNATADEQKFVEVDKTLVPDLLDRQVLGNLLLHSHVLCGEDTPSAVEARVTKKYVAGYIVRIVGYSTLNLTHFVLPLHLFPFHVEGAIVDFGDESISMEVRHYMNPSAVPWTPQGMRIVYFDKL